MPPSQPLPQSMVAWQHHASLVSPGPMSKSLTLNQIAPVPQLKKANQTLVKVLTASINPIDYKLRQIPFVGRLSYGGLNTPGQDFVGRVWATNLPESAGIKPGDLVFGRMTGTVQVGTLAGFTIADGLDNIVKAPPGVKEIDHLAALGTAGLAAYQSLVPFLEKRGEGSARGTSVFINGASGGVGTFTVQFAKAIGCEHIVASCSGANADLVKSLGATEVIDYRSVNVVDALNSFVKNSNGGKKLDHIVDNVGADWSIYWHAHEYLKEDGTYAFLGGGFSVKDVVDLVKVNIWPSILGGGKRQFQFLLADKGKKDLERMARWIDQGQVKAVFDQTYSMDQAKEAYERITTGRARGNIMIRVSEDGRGDS